MICVCWADSYGMVNVKKCVLPAANTRVLTCVVLMLVHCLRRWPNLIASLAQRPVSCSPVAVNYNLILVSSSICIMVKRLCYVGYVGKLN